MMSQVRVTVRDIGELGPGVARLDIEGYLDWNTFHRVDEAIIELFSRDVHFLVVGLGKLKYISSVGFGCFIGALDKARKRGGNIIFLQVPSRIKEVFGILGLSQILSFVETEAEAISLLRQQMGSERK